MLLNSICRDKWNLLACCLSIKSKRYYNVEDTSMMYLVPIQLEGISAILSKTILLYFNSISYCLWMYVCIQNAKLNFSMYFTSRSSRPADSIPSEHDGNSKREPVSQNQGSPSQQHLGNLHTLFHDLCFVWPKRVSDNLPVRHMTLESNDTNG